MPHRLGAIEARHRIGEGTLTSVELVKACLAQIEASDATLRAWVHLDPEQALGQAEGLDRLRQAGRALGLLHGIPVGLKDVIDTREQPTERGTPIFAGRQPDHDAAVVDRLREAGAVILGKTVTTELAFLHPAATRNPHDTDATPGGSSSGSAASVAACQVPLAIGTQTAGSVIRPAAFCGTYGFKPSRGMISRRGVLQTSGTLDQVGVFARTLGDAALLADVLGGYDPQDPLSFARPRPRLLEGSRAEVPIEPNFAVLALPYDAQASADACSGLAELIEVLGPQVERLSAPASFGGLVEAQKVIHEYEITRHLEDAFKRHWDLVSPPLRTAVERGRAIEESRYQDALGALSGAVDYFESFFRDFDAILSLSAPGEAPLFESGTGDPVFCRLWTLCGLPALSLPLLVGRRGLPVGVQLIGAAEEDDRLLRTANWMLQTLRADPAEIAED